MKFERIDFNLVKYKSFDIISASQPTYPTEGTVVKMVKLI